MCMHAHLTDRQSGLKSNINPKIKMCHAGYVRLCVDLYILSLVRH